MSKQLESFFGSGNGWDLEKIKSGTYPAPLSFLLFKMLKNALENSPPYILPRLDANKTLWFYICAEDKVQLHEINGILKSSLGNSRIYFDPVDYTDSTDPCEQLLLEKFVFGFSRAFIPPVLNANKPMVYETIESLNEILELFRSRPTTIYAVKRPLGVILRSFFTGCEFNQNELIDESLKEIRQQQAISQRNLLSLEFQALYAKREYHSVVGHSKFVDSLNVTVPKVLQSVFLTSIYESYKEVLESDDTDKIRGVLGRYFALFNTEPSLPKTNLYCRAWKCWFIGHAIFGFIKSGYQIPDNLCVDWANSFLAAIGIEHTSPEASELFQSRIATTQDLLDASPSFENLSALVLKAANLSLSAQQEIYSVLSGYPNEILDELSANKSLIILWENLENEFKNAENITSWFSLFSALKDDGGLYKEYRQSVIHNCKAWDIGDCSLEQLDSIITEIIEPESIKALREVLPLFMGWLDENKLLLPCNSIEHLVFCLASDDIQHKEDLLLCAELLKQFFSSPHNVLAYENTLTHVRECWEKVSSVDTIDYAIEVTEMIIDSPCANEQIKIALWNSISQVAVNYWNRLNQIQQIVIKDLSEIIVKSSDFLPAISEDDTEQELPIDLSKKRLAIYSLTESAARRASKILQTMYPGLEVKTNSDKSATEALTSLIKSADYFIFAARSSAHQAFYPLTSARKDIIYPEGKGSSSIVRAFKELYGGKTRLK